MSAAQLKSLLGKMATRKRSAEPDHEQLRTMLNALAETFPVAKEVAVRGVDADGSLGLQFDAPGANPQRVLLYAHGGGYVAGSPIGHGDLAGRLSRAAGARVLSLDYRLAPEYPFPAAMEDLATGYAWVLKQGIKPQNVVFGGDSAGGGLVMTALIALRQAGAPMPAGAVLLSPWIDLRMTGDSITSKAEEDPLVSVAGLHKWAAFYLAGVNGHAPHVSPLHAHLGGLPPLLIEVGSREVLLDDATRLAQRAQAAGIPVTLNIAEGMVHVWQIFSPVLDEGRESIDRIGAWISKQMRG